MFFYMHAFLLSGIGRLYFWDQVGRHVFAPFADPLNTFNAILENNQKK